MRIFRFDASQRQRQPDHKARPFAWPWALHVDRPTVKFDKVLGNGETETEARVMTTDRTLGLRKTIEYVGQKVLADADARVLDRDFDLRIDLPQGDRHAPTSRGELDRVGQ
jgi:hypothetical protein